MKKVMKDRSTYRYVAFLIAVLAVLVVFIALPHLDGSFNGSFWNGLTGAATSSTTTLAVIINSAPVVNVVQAVIPQSVSEGTTTLMAFKFNVTDADGFGTINNMSATVRINYTGTPDNYNTSNNVTCFPFLQTSTTSITFGCNVTVWYFAQAANWTINASINDTEGVYAENISTTFQIVSLTAMNMYPTALTWPTMDLGDTNISSSADPIRINNTGNDDIDVGGVTVAGYNLQGLTTLTQYINSENFSVYAANLTSGNNSIKDGTGASGQEEIYFCLRTVSAGLSRQTYNTAGASSSPWSVAVS